MGIWAELVRQGLTDAKKASFHPAVSALSPQNNVQSGKRDELDALWLISLLVEVTQAAFRGFWGVDILATASRLSETQWEKQ